jgi:thymidylate synthase ThyX
MSKISATIVADSKNQFGNRLTTFVLTFPRYILAEFNTHRMVSKNSASSRAIPFAKMLASVKTNPFIPIAWMKDHKGMQGSDYFNLDEIFVSPNGIENPNNYTTGQVLEATWLAARDKAVETAQYLSDIGLTKQIVNRILEPFMWHTVICTASEWQNFFKLRASEFADIHIQKLAYEMLEAYNSSTPKELAPGEWHIPFGDKINLPPTIPIDPGYTLDEGVAIRKVKIATARCARISYTVVGEEGKPDNYDNDILLHDRLMNSGHFSPFEHIAQSMTDYEYAFNSSYNDDDGEDGTWGWSGNFRGFVQYRKMLPNENQTDARVLAK